MGLMQDAFKTANEVSIKAEMEREVVVYARVTNPAGLEQAVRVIFQDQAQIKTDHGSIRVRKSVENGKTTYEMTSKVRQKKDGVQNMLEATVPITEEAFVLFRDAAPARMVKNRYYFRVEKATVAREGGGVAIIPLKDLFYEVDIFYKADGSNSDWVKIDVEIQDLDKQLAAAGVAVTNPKLKVKLSQLPFEPTAAVADDVANDVDKVELIKMLYDTQFLILQHEDKEEVTA